MPLSTHSKLDLVHESTAAGVLEAIVDQEFEGLAAPFIIRCKTGTPQRMCWSPVLSRGPRPLSRI